MLASLVVNPKNNTKEAGMQHPQSMSVLVEPAESLDALCFGDSYMETGVSPLVMYEQEGFTSFNCAAWGKPMPFMLHLLNYSLENQTPKLVVLEASELYSPFSAFSAVNRELMEAFPIFQYHERWKTLGVEDFTTSPQYTWSDPDKGFIIRTEISGGTNTDYMGVQTGLDPVPFLARAYAKAFVDRCTEEGAKVLFVSVPNANDWNQGRHQAVQNLADELGVDYVDMNLDDLGIDWTLDTWDGGEHLNTRGALKVTRSLGPLLKEKYGLPDHRGQEAYSSWDEGSVGYTAKLAALEYA